MSDVTRILSAIEEGDAHAAEQLLPLVYDEFRKFGGTVLVQRFLRGRLLRQRGGLSGRIQLLSLAGGAGRRAADAVAGQNRYRVAIARVGAERLPNDLARGRIDDHRAGPLGQRVSAFRILWSFDARTCTMASRNPPSHSSGGGHGWSPQTIPDPPATKLEALNQICGRPAYLPGPLCIPARQRLRRL